jgi:hypothetical protein
MRKTTKRRAAMKRSVVAISVLIGCCLGWTASAVEEPLKSPLEQRRAAKLASPWLRGWITDYAKALEESRNTHKPIFSYFTRSDIVLEAAQTLEHHVFMSPEFDAWSENAVLFCHLTTGIPGDPDAGLLESKGGTRDHLPYFVFMDDEGRVVPHRGAPTVPGLAETGNKVSALMDLRRKANEGSKDAAIELVFAAAELGVLPPKEMGKQLEGKGPLTEAQQARLESLRSSLEIGAEVAGILASVRRNDPNSAVEAGRRFAEMKRAGRSPSQRDAHAFWSLILRYAESCGDVALYEETLGIVVEKFGQDPAASRVIADAERRLQRMKRASEPRTP